MLSDASDILLQLVRRDGINGNYQSLCAKSLELAAEFHACADAFEAKLKTAKKQAAGSGNDAKKKKPSAASTAPGFKRKVSKTR